MENSLPLRGVLRWMAEGGVFTGLCNVMSENPPNPPFEKGDYYQRFTKYEHAIYP